MCDIARKNLKMLNLDENIIDNKLIIIKILTLSIHFDKVGIFTRIYR